MSNIFLCSDHHEDHKNILTFTRSNGSPLRVFEDIVHMNEYIIMKHNRVVKPNDKVYFLGDVTMARNAKGLEFLRRMNGEKILIKGNHDLAPASAYLEHFKDIRAVHQLDGMILSHIPVHPESLSRWKANIHGHLHDNVVLIEGTKIPDPRYYSVCMERLNDYTPVSLEDIKKDLKI